MDSFIVYHVRVFFQFSNYVKNQLDTSQIIENEYINPKNVDIVFPKQKKNLICIYVDSAEITLQDKINGGAFEYNYITEMTELANNNISFSQHGDYKIWDYYTAIDEI